MNKLINFLKEWTLPVSMTTGILVYFIFYFTPALDEASRVFNSFFDFILPWILFVILFVTFCRANFHRMRPCWWHFVILAMQLVLVIVSTALIVHYHASGNELVLMECIICCVICPCATAAPVVTAKLDGDLEKMTTFMLLSNFLAAVLIPTVFPLVDESIDMPFWDAFVALLKRVYGAAGTNGSGLCSEALCSSPAPPHHEQQGLVVLPVGRAAAGDIGSHDAQHHEFGHHVVVYCGSGAHEPRHHLCAVAIGRYVGRFFHATTEMGQAMGQKNTAFAIWISSAWLNPLAAVGPGFYILWQNAFNSLEIWHHEKMHKS